MRERSHWGWGWADKFPDEAGQRALAQQVGAVLGLKDLVPRRPVPLAEADVPAARVEVPPTLAGFCTAEREARALHTYGKAYRDQVRAFAGDFGNAPDLVAAPRTEAEIDATLAWAAANGAAVVPFGGGTSVVGGVECPRAARDVTVSLDLRRFDRVLEVDDVSRLARIQAGMTGPAIEAALKPHGLTLRHFPQSFAFSTLGGWLATRAGGHFATVYTHIDDLAAGVRMVTPTGVWASRPLPGSGAGPSPDRMVLGSEGALGVITEGWMRVRPRPLWRASAAAHFADFAAAVAATRALAQSGLFPTNCRLLDRREAALNMVAMDGSCVLLLGFESADHPVRPWMERAVELVSDHGGALPRAPTFVDREEGDQSASGAKGRDADAGSWRSAFLEGPYLQSTLLSLGVLVDTFETACTWAGFDALHAAVTEAVLGALRSTCGGGRLTCRFTHVYPDGPAPYYTFIGRARPGAELEQWAAVKAAASEALLAHGATITHHHAVGRTHQPWYARQRPAPFAAALAAAKRAVDPDSVLNPGVLVD